MGLRSRPTWLRGRWQGAPAHDRAGLLTYLSAVMPGTEVPAYGLLAGHRRRRPYIFSDAEIEALTAAAATAPPRDSLLPSMLATLLGLLASTGLRVGEAIRLTMDELRPVREGARRASLHSFRHSFAVRRLRAWHEAGLDVQTLLPTLSVYLGHVRPEDTYWYLTATPDLLRAAGSRFTPDGVVGDAP